MKYITVEHLAKEAIALGKDSLIAKIDIKAAYDLIPVAPKDHLCLGMIWEEKFILTLCCLLVLDQHQKIFNAVADALEWCMIKEGVNIIYHYLDDFAVLAPLAPRSVIPIPNTEVSLLGLSSRKAQAGPSNCIEFFGIIIDMVKQELQLPRDKLYRLLRAV